MREYVSFSSLAGGLSKTKKCSGSGFHLERNGFKNFFQLFFTVKWINFPNLWEQKESKQLWETFRLF